MIVMSLASKYSTKMNDYRDFDANESTNHIESCSLNFFVFLWILWASNLSFSLTILFFVLLALVCVCCAYFFICYWFHFLSFLKQRFIPNPIPFDANYVKIGIELDGKTYLQLEFLVSHWYRTEPYNVLLACVYAGKSVSMQYSIGKSVYFVSLIGCICVSVLSSTHN